MLRFGVASRFFERFVPGDDARQEGDVLWAPVMPHDGAIYLVVTADGELVS